MSAQPKEDQPRWSEYRLMRQYEHAADVLIQTNKFGPEIDSEVVLAYVNGLTIGTHVSLVVLPELRKLWERDKRFDTDTLRGVLPLVQVESNVDTEQMSEALFEGNLILLFKGSGMLYRMSMDFRPMRQPSESSTEISIKGPKDCFIEDINVNIALLRKRIRSDSLAVEIVTLGERTKTKVSILYFRDILSPDILNELKQRMDKIKLDGIFSINQLEEGLSTAKLNLLPMLAFTGRPDYVVNSLLAGRFAIIVDGNPLVLVGPATLSLILKSPEDIHFNYMYVSFTRVIRAFSLFCSIFLPGIWVALMAFHQDQIPFRLMATVAVSRLGLPFSPQMELFILLALLEIFREAGVRLPGPIGQTLTSIGGLIIGDAAIRAGLVSPSVVVIGAITAVCGVTLVNQSLSTISSVFRMFFFLMGAVLGMFGLILGVVLMTVYLSRTKSFGVPYMAPWSPLKVHEFVKSYLRVPWFRMNDRSLTLNPVDPDRQGEQRE